MSEGGTERLLERAERSVAMERDAAVARIRGGLTAEGSADCEDCGEPIDAKRRAVLPSARTCVRCQTARESGRSGRPNASLLEARRSGLPNASLLEARRR